MKVYVSGPFFNTIERERMEMLRSYLLTKYDNIYLPIELVIPNAWELSEKEWAKIVYDKDMTELDNSDLMVVIYDGHYSDSGTAFEIGYAKAKGIETHILIVNPEDTQSLMITNCTPFVYLFKDYIINQLNILSLSELTQS